MAARIQRAMAYAAFSLPLAMFLSRPAFAEVPKARIVGSESEGPPESEGANGAPGPKRGYQMAIRTGYAAPMGSATGAPGDDLAKTFGGQLRVLADLGYKPSANIFLGIYAGVGIGTEGSELTNECSGRVSCSSLTLRGGLQFQGHLLPDTKVNPWMGYGIGLESTTFSAEGPGGEASVRLFGFELAHFMAGIDFRINKIIGVGPALDLSIAQYVQLSRETGGFSSGASIDIANTALHGWMTFGARLVFFP